MAQGDLRGTPLSVAQNSITNPTTAAGSVAVSVGDLVYVVGCSQGALTWGDTPTDNLGNTYTALNAGDDAGAATARAYYSRVTAAGTLTAVNVPATASADNAIVIAAAVEGPFLVSPLDANPANLTDDLTDPLTCPATGTLAQASEMVMCFYASNGNPTVNADSPNLLALEVNSGTTVNLSVGYQKVAATTSVAPTFDLSGGPTDSVLGTASFKLAAARTSTGAGTPGATTGAGTAEVVKTSEGATAIAAITGAGEAAVAGEKTSTGDTTAPKATGAGASVVARDTTGATTAPVVTGAGTAEREVVSEGATTVPAATGEGLAGIEGQVGSTGDTTAPAATGEGSADVEGEEPEPEPEPEPAGRYDLGGGPGGGRRAERIRRKRIEPSLAAVRMLGLEDTGPVRAKPKPQLEPVAQVARVAQEPEPEKAPDLTLQNALATAMNAEVQRKVEAVRAELKRREEEEAAFAEMDLDLLMLVSEW